MGSPDINDLKPKNISYKYDNFRYDKLRESIIYQSKDNYFKEKAELYKNNYLNSILNVYGEYGVDLYNFIEKIDPDVLLNAARLDQSLSIEFTYLETSLDGIEKAEIILNRWIDIIDKGF